MNGDRYLATVDDHDATSAEWKTKKVKVNEKCVKRQFESDRLSAELRTKVETSLCLTASNNSKHPTGTNPFDRVAEPIGSIVFVQYETLLEDRPLIKLIWKVMSNENRFQAGNQIKELLEVNA